MLCDSKSNFIEFTLNIDKHGLHILEISSNKQFLYFPDWWKNINKMKDTKIEWNKYFLD